MSGHVSAVLRALAACVAVALSLCAAAPALAAEGAAPLPPTIKIRPVLVPVVSTRGEVQRYNHLEVTLELLNAAKVPEAQAIAPRLQDAVLGVIYIGVEKGWIVNGAITNAQAVRQKILERSEALMGRASVTRILITPVAKQASWP
ncbi:hypothetical protein M2352_002384 [Azospirillum fermentarium]|uniref:hypothetical protein n=1 Tax=Azospirillum fermentarium TaxID=1233114 RepID=UPI002227C938|nr:hypothetical protein [Azospirillum fermentarium]MCW2246793.1 hypothetical protein [Azospirillum fermentarium]